MIHQSIAHLAVPTIDLKHHPRNPRRGDVALIAESLERNGQYRPLVVQESTGHVLGGNHTLAAARRLGWPEVAATMIDVTDEEALRILVADNRTAELGFDHSEQVVELLHELNGELEGSGYDFADLDALELGDLGDIFGEEGGVDPPEPGKGDGEDRPVRLRVEVGPVRFGLSGPLYDRWLVAAADEAGVPGVVDRMVLNKAVGPLLLSRLGLPNVQRQRETKSRRAKSVAEGSVAVRPDLGEMVPVDSLVPHPDNPREGDVGAIAESLAVNGMFRPVIVRRDTNEILAGNHTWRAAQLLGAVEVPVVFLDIDETEAKRILLVDNRSNAVGGTDSDTLVDILVDLAASSLEGSGFGLDDLDDLLAERDKLAGNATISNHINIQIKVGAVWVKVDKDEFVKWYDALCARHNWDDPSIKAQIGNDLQLPEGWEK